VREAETEREKGRDMYIDIDVDIYRCIEIFLDTYI